MELLAEDHDKLFEEEEVAVEALSSDLETIDALHAFPPLVAWGNFLVRMPNTNHMRSVERAHVLIRDDS